MVPTGTLWSDEERAQLATMLAQGMSRRECGEALGRTPKSVGSHMLIHGLRSKCTGGTPSAYARSRVAPSFTEGNQEFRSVHDAPRAASGSGPDLYSGGSGSSPERGSAVQQASGDVRRLVDFCRARPRSLRDVCDHLGCSPKAAEFLYEQARANGYSVDLSGAEIAWRRVDVNERTTRAKIEPVAGEYHVGVMSDTHYGSKYCEPDWIEDWVERAYTKGVRRIVHAGDLLAGQSEKIRWDLSHHGLDAQCQEAFERLPKRPGLEYHFIDGNHDEHFRNLVGQETGYRVVEYFKARGRHDVVCAGQRAGLVLLEAPVCKRPIVVKLWHPKAGKSYAISYQPQNHIRDMGVGVKPDVLVCGHWHVAGYFCQRGVHALLGGTFENPGSSFSKSLGGAVANGATILSFGITEHGTIRDLEYKWTSYYVEERARSLELSPAGIAISKRQDEVLAEALLSLQQLVGALRGEVS